MRRWVGLAVLAILWVVAAGCMGGATHHGTLSAKDALTQAREDGFVKPTRVHPGSWQCDGKTTSLGSGTSSGTDVFVRPTYALTFGDRRVPDAPDNSARIAMMVVVFPNESVARLCAKAGIYGATHIQVNPSDNIPGGPYRPYKLIGSTTVKTHMHVPGAPGSASAQDDGEYDTWLAHGRVFALGLAHNGPHSKIVRDDLQQLAAEIAG